MASTQHKSKFAKLQSLSETYQDYDAVSKVVVLCPTPARVKRESLDRPLNTSRAKPADRGSFLAGNFITLQPGWTE